MKKVVYSPDAIEKFQKIERQVRAEYGDNTARKVKKAITGTISTMMELYKIISIAHTGSGAIAPDLLLSPARGQNICS